MAKDEQEDTLDAFRGTILEPLSLQYARRRASGPRVNAVLQHPDPELSWMLANIDQIVGDVEVQILECKTAGLHSAIHRRDRVPRCAAGVQHRLLSLASNVADVAVLGCRSEAGHISYRTDELY